MKSRRTKTEHSPKHEQRAASERASQLLATRLRTGLVVAAVALLFASVLMPSEGAIREGAYAPLAAGRTIDVELALSFPPAQGVDGDGQHFGCLAWPQFFGHT